jgi:hypothetical protein
MVESLLDNFKVSIDELATRYTYEEERAGKRDWIALKNVTPIQLALLNNHLHVGKLLCGNSISFIIDSIFLFSL